MKKVNKTYEAPKAEMVELNVNGAFMQGPVVSGGPTWPEEES